MTIRGCLAIVLLILGGANSWAASGSPPDPKTLNAATDIVQTYGSGQRITKDELKIYLAAQTLKRFHPDDNGILDLREFMKGFLYCKPGTPWTCKITTAYDDYKNLGLDPKDNAANAKALYAKNDMFRHIVDAMLERQWILVCLSRKGDPKNLTQTERDSCKVPPGDASLDDIAAYLTEHAVLATTPVAVDERERRFFAGASSNCRYPWELPEVAADARMRRVDFIKRFFEEQFESADSDGNCQLDLLEFKSISDFPDVTAEFAQAAGADFLLSEEEFLKAYDLGDETAGLTYATARAAESAFVMYEQIQEPNASPTPPVVTVGSFETKATAEYKAAEADAENEAKKGVAGIGMIPGSGLVLYGNRRYSSLDKAITLDTSKAAVLLRISEDFRKVGDSADSAELGWAKDNGKAAPAIDISPRLDLYVPGLYSAFKFKPFIAAHFNQSGTGDERTVVNTYFLGAESFFYFGPGGLQGVQVTFGGQRQIDIKKHVKTESAIFDFRPNFRLGRFVTGANMPLFGDAVQVYVDPRISAELNHLVSATPVTPPPDTSDMILWEVAVGIDIGERLKVQYTFDQRNAFANFGDNYQLHVGSISLQLDADDIFELKASYKNGAEPPTYGRTRKYSVGLAAKF